MEFGKKKSLALFGRLRKAGQRTHRCPVRARLHPRFPEAQFKSEGARTRSTSRYPPVARAPGLTLRVPPRARPHAGRSQHKPRPYLCARAGLRAPREGHGRSGVGSLRLRFTRPASPGAPRPLPGLPPSIAASRRPPLPLAPTEGLGVWWGSEG